MDTNGVAVTLSVAAPEMLFTVSVAVMMIGFTVALVLVELRAVARPYEPRELPMVATVSSEVLQVTAVVQFSMVPSEKIA